MTTNYEKGRKKEYKIMKKLKEQGYDIVFRTAGSHSPIDVVGINKEKRRIICVQSKPKSMSENAKKKLQGGLSWLNDCFIINFIVD
jgi:Holliday junction resolvase